MSAAYEVHLQDGEINVDFQVYTTMSSSQNAESSPYRSKEISLISRNVCHAIYQYLKPAAEAKVYWREEAVPER